MFGLVAVLVLVLWGFILLWRILLSRIHTLAHHWTPIFIYKNLWFFPRIKITWFLRLFRFRRLYGDWIKWSILSSFCSFNMIIIVSYRYCYCYGYMLYTCLLAVSSPDMSKRFWPRLFSFIVRGGLSFYGSVRYCCVRKFSVRDCRKRRPQNLYSILILWGKISHLHRTQWLDMID